MKTTVMNAVKAFTLIALGLAIAAMGIYLAEADDAPGAAVIGMLLMVLGVVLGVMAARNLLPKWATRTALAGGMVMSLMTERDIGIVIAVTSNMAHANTSSLARRVGDAFAGRPR